MTRKWVVGLMLVIYSICISFTISPSCFASEEYIETGIAEEEICIIDPYYDIAPQHESTIAPMPCIAVMVLSYYRILPIQPVKTKNGIHPFSTYVTETYTVDGKEFVNGSMGAYSPQDPFLIEYLMQHGIEIEEQTNVSSEEDIVWYLRKNLLKKNCCLLSFSRKSPVLVLGIKDYPNETLVTIFDPSEGDIISLNSSYFLNTTCTLFAYHYSSGYDTSVWKEISLLLEKRVKHFFESILWDIEIWFYKELNSFLIKMKEINPFSGF